MTSRSHTRSVVLSESEVAAAADAIRSNGFAILHGVVSATSLLQLDQKMTADLPAWLHSHTQQHGYPAFNWIYGNVQQLPPRSSQFVFADVLCNTAIAQVAKRVLGASCALTGYTGNTNMPDSQWQPVHRDAKHDDEPLRKLVANICTSSYAVTEENGAIELWPASHLEEEVAEVEASVLAGNTLHMLTGGSPLSLEQATGGVVHPALVERRRAAAPPVRDSPWGCIDSRYAPLA